MEIEELLEFIKQEHNRLLNLYNVQDKNQLKHPITIKIMEEVGELAQEILAQDSLQRKDKLANNTLDNNKEKVADELVDVLITTLILAENTGIDIKSSIKKAIEKRKLRNY